MKYYLFVFLTIGFMSCTGAHEDESRIKNESSNNDVVTTPTETVAPQSAPTLWHPVKSWKGNGMKATEKFTIASNSWRIIYHLPSGVDVFQIYCYDESGNMDILANVINQEAYSDTAYIYKSGTYHLTLNTTDKYTVSVEEGN